MINWLLLFLQWLTHKSQVLLDSVRKLFHPCHKYGMSNCIWSCTEEERASILDSRVASCGPSLSWDFNVSLHGRHIHDRTLYLESVSFAGLGIPWQLAWNHLSQRSHDTPQSECLTGSPHTATHTSIFTMIDDVLALIQGDSGCDAGDGGLVINGRTSAEWESAWLGI